MVQWLCSLSLLILLECPLCLKLLDSQNQHYLYEVSTCQKVPQEGNISTSNQDESHLRVVYAVVQWLRSLPLLILLDCPLSLKAFRRTGFLHHKCHSAVGTAAAAAAAGAAAAAASNETGAKPKSEAGAMQQPKDPHNPPHTFETKPPTNIA
jgi:hypothetical protein